MKICFFAYGILEQGGGLENYFIETAKEISKSKNITIDIVTLDDKYTYRLVKLISLFYFRKPDISKVKKIPSDVILDKTLGLNYIKSKSIQELKRILSGYDLIYSKNEIVESVVLKFAVGYKLLPPIIYGCHTPIHYPIADSFQAKIHNFLYCGLVYKILANQVSGFHVLNSSDENVMKKLFPKSFIYKIRNPFDYARFSLNMKKHKKDLSLNQSNFKILWVGRMVLQKGVHDLSDIITHVNNLVGEDKVSWTIVGSGSEDQNFRSLTEACTNVLRLGQIDNKYVPNIISQHDILINTSHWEGYPYNLVEAQAANKPVLAYNIPGCNDLIIDGINGSLVNDISEFVSSLVEYIHGNIKLKMVQDTTSSDNPAIYAKITQMYTSIYEKKNKK